MFLIQHVNGKILHCLVHFEGQRTIFWYRLIFVVSLYGLNLYSFYWVREIWALRKHKILQVLQV